jgi:hypothetical protein
VTVLANRITAQIIQIRKCHGRRRHAQPTTPNGGSSAPPDRDPPLLPGLAIVAADMTAGRPVCMFIHDLGDERLPLLPLMVRVQVMSVPMSGQ